MDQKIKESMKNSVRIRRLSELNENDELVDQQKKCTSSNEVKPKPRDKLQAKKVKSDEDSASMCSSVRPNSSISKGSVRNSIASGKTSSESSKKITNTSTIETKSPEETSDFPEPSGELYLETIDRLVDANGEVIAKNETVKYLGKSASLGSGKTRKNSLVSLVSSLSKEKSKGKDKDKERKLSSESLIKIEPVERKEIYVETSHVLKKETADNMSRK